MHVKIISLALVGMLSLAFANPASADGFRGGSRGGFHRGHGFHQGHGGFHRFGCCFGPVFLGGAFLGATLAAPYYYYPYPYAYQGYSPPPYQGYSPPVYQTQAYVAPSVQREVCYVGGCYRLQGDGVTVAYQWVWLPNAPPPPPGPPSR
jgi:hypothetical protein